MNAQLPRLIELQAVDLRIAEIKSERRQIPDRLDTAQQPLRAAATAQQTASAEVETLTKERRACERELEAHEAQVEKMKARTTEIKTNKEYQAHLFEIEMAGKKKGEIEERILGYMEQIDALQNQLKETQAAVVEAERAFGVEKKRLEELDSKLAAELAQLDARQQSATAGVPRDLLERYTKLKGQRKDQALAAVRDGICQGCRLQLPPQLVAAVKRSDELLICSYCQRMLYWEGELPVVARAAAPVGRDQDDEAGESV